MSDRITNKRGKRRKIRKIERNGGTLTVVDAVVNINLNFVLR